MTSTEMTSILERAGARLHPDVEALVAGAVRRGRRRRRRSGGLVAAGLVAVLGLGLGWTLVPRSGDVDQAIDPGTATPTQRPLASTEQVTRGVLGLLADRDVTRVRVTSLDMGERTDVLDGLRLTMRIDGAVVSVDVGDFSSEGENWSPQKFCDSPECQELPDGSWLWPRSGNGGDGVADGHGFLANWATDYTADGWMVQVQANNSDNPGAGRPHVVADGPVLSMAEAVALATSDLWFGPDGDY